VDRRLVCIDCGVKWFVPSGAPVPDDEPPCTACGGKLRPLLDLVDEDSRPGWGAQADV
jgi:hypothetical protein